MSTTTAPTVERIDVDPKQLLLDVNIRLDARLDKDFVGSIKDHGVLMPIIVVRTADGSLRVRFGHRRTLAAIEVGLGAVPVEVIGNEGSDDASQVERIVTQHAENAYRASLTSADELNVVEQLSAFGLSAGQIQKRTRIKRAAVDAALAVSSSDLAKKATERYDFLSLNQAAAVAEFQDNDDAVKSLIVSAKEGRFEHILQRLRDDREEQQAKQGVIAELAEAGVTVVDRPSYGSSVTRLTSLTSGGESLDETNHAHCPGHAAFLEETWEDTDDETDADDEEAFVSVWVPVYVCTDPEANGHDGWRSEHRRSKQEPTGEEAEKARNERRIVLANNKAWRSAETVRREWLRSFLTKKTAPKDASRYIYSAIAEGNYALTDAMEKGHEFACDLLGLDVNEFGSRSYRQPLLDMIANATDGRAQVIVLGLTLGGCESHTDVYSWRSPTNVIARYLNTLASWGYVLSDVEKLAAGVEVEQ